MYFFLYCAFLQDLDASVCGAVFQWNEGNILGKSYGKQYAGKSYSATAARIKK